MADFFRNHKLLLKYLISYVVVLMIPVLSFTAFIEQSLMERMRHRFEIENTQSLEQFAVSVDNNLSRLDVVRDHILARRDLAVAKNLTDVLAAMHLINELKTYTISNTAFTDLVFWVNGDDYIYTSNSAYRLDNFFSGRHYYQEWSTEEFLEQTRQMRGRQIRPQEPVLIRGDKRQSMTIIYPVRYRGTPVTLMFLIDADSLIPSGIPSAFYIQDQNGRTLYQNDSHVADSLEMEGISPDGMDGAWTERAFKQGYLIADMQSPVTSLSYVKVSPVKEVYGEVRLLQRRFCLILFLLLCVGLLAIWLSMTVNYKPLSRLWLRIQRLGKDRDGAPWTGIGIHDAIDGLVSEHMELKERTYDASKGHFLYLLIKERLGEEEFMRQARLLSMEDLLSPWFFVLIVAVKKEDVAKVEAAGIEQVIREHLPGYLREDGDHGKFVFVGSLDSDADLPYTHKVLDVQDALQSRLGVDVVVARSGLKKGLGGVPRCYMDAVMAVDYRFIRGYNCVIDSSMIALNGNIGNVYPKQMFEKLNYQVQNGDADKIQKSLNELIDYIKSAGLPLYYAKGLCYQLLNNISAVIQRINEDLSIHQRLSYGTILADYDTVDELIGAIRNISMNICAYIRDEKSKEEQKLILEIKDYIREKALDQEFAIQNMAADFHMALPALSTFFKNQCGVTVIDYVTRYRMEEAVRLLLEEGLAVREIVERVGYMDTSSFIRKFKSIYGLTPGQYVKQYKEGQIYR